MFTPEFTTQKYPTVEFANYYREKFGWSTFPVHSKHLVHCTCGRSGCVQPGRHPMDLDYKTISTKSELEFDKCWRRSITRETANIGVHLGSKSNLISVVIDNSKIRSACPVSYAKSIYSCNLCKMECTEVGNLLKPQGCWERTARFASWHGPRVRLLFSIAPGVVVPRFMRLSSCIGVSGDDSYIIVPPSGPIANWPISCGPWDSSFSVHYGTRLDHIVLPAPARLLEAIKVADEARRQRLAA